jgi:hypothetical protein
MKTSLVLSSLLGSTETALPRLLLQRHHVAIVNRYDFCALFFEPTVGESIRKAF